MTNKDNWEVLYMKHYLYYVGMKYKGDNLRKWDYVQTYIVSSKENIEKNVKMIIRNCMNDDPSSQFKDYKYFKIKKASNKEIKSSVLNENFLCRADRTKVLHIPKSLLLYDLGKKYEGQIN